MMTMSIPLEANQVEELENALSILGDVINTIDGQRQKNDLQDIYQELEYYMKAEQ